MPENAVKSPQATPEESIGLWLAEATPESAAKLAVLAGSASTREIQQGAICALYMLSQRGIVPTADQQTTEPSPQDADNDEAWQELARSTFQPGVLPSGKPVHDPAAQTGVQSGPKGIILGKSASNAVAPSASKFVLTPAGRTFLVAVIAAAIIGGSVAAGVIGLQNGYSNYQQTNSSQKINTLIDKGADAYKSGDFSMAANLFEQAMASSPVAAQRAIISKNLAFTYVQQARAANGRGEWQIAVGLYRKAIELATDYDTPRKELADLLAQHGDRQGAEEQRSALPSAPAPDTTPTQLTNHLSTSGVAGIADNSAQIDPAQFLEQQRAEARRLIDEGKQLFRQGRLDAAREKWQEATSKAPGTPERDEASQLLDRYPPPAADPGY